jgi:uncharacterized 2Fe-2S/4Fe-4S cluster protein (DUF4445 family)
MEYYGHEPTMKHTVVFQPFGRRTIVDGGETIMGAARRVGIVIEGICGKQSTCGKCKVRIEQGFSEHCGIESKWESLDPKGDAEKDTLGSLLHEGYRLAC